MWKILAQNWYKLAARISNLLFCDCIQFLPYRPECWQCTKPLFNSFLHYIYSYKFIHTYKSTSMTILKNASRRKKKLPFLWLCWHVYKLRRRIPFCLCQFIIYTVTPLLKGQCHEIPIQLQFFFHESVSPKPLSISLGPFRIFSKSRGDIRSSIFCLDTFGWRVDR